MTPGQVRRKIETPAEISIHSWESHEKRFHCGATRVVVDTSSEWSGASLPLVPYGSASTNENPLSPGWSSSHSTCSARSSWAVTERIRGSPVVEGWDR